MAVFRCKMCGGTIEFNQGDTVGVCDSCGTKQTLPRLDDDRKVNLYDRANHFRRNNEFDKAMGIYEQILSEDNTDAEAYWSVVLCKYGIEYVEDPSTHKRVPTVNRAQYTSIFADEDYKSAIKYADGYQRDVYEEEAKAIDEIQKGILEISNKEEPFDVFICYKETDTQGRRTHDSVYAQDIYSNLTKEGYRVFFARLTLEDKIGTAYEPYIFAALNSAKVMIVVGTSNENLNAAWVKNEWSRYLAIVKQDNSKVLIPCYKDMNPYDMPEEFAYLQAQDMSKIGFMQDLIRGLQKYISNHTDSYIDNPSGIANSKSLLKRGFIFLEDGKWDNANEYFEKVLDSAPENSKAYLGKFMLSEKIKHEEDIGKTPKIFDSNEENLKKALFYASKKEKSEIENYLKSAEDEYNRIDSLIKQIIDGEEIIDSAEEKFHLYELAATNGNPVAQYMLGKCYENGYCCEVNNKLAFESYLNSAEQDSDVRALALYKIGFCLYWGLGVAKDIQRANAYFQYSADMNNPEALYRLGINYCDGIGVNKDTNKGIDLLNTAASYGHSRAYKSLGDISYFGYYGFEKNLDSAIEKYNSSILCEDEEVLDKINQIDLQSKKEHDIIDKANMRCPYCGAEIAEGLMMCTICGAVISANNSANQQTVKQQSNKNEISTAYLNLSRCYQQKQQYDTAVSILNQGAEKGSADCQNELGLFYENGSYVPEDKNQAFLWFEKSANNSYGVGMYNLGRFYESGICVEKDNKKAIDLYTEAARKGVPMAYYKCGLNAYNLKEYSAAKTYYEKAAEKNIMLAYNQLGYMYESGVVGRIKGQADKKTALQYFVKAAQAGVADAQNNAGRLYQEFGEVEKALGYYKKAAEKGHEEGLKNYENLMKWKTDNDKRLSKIDKAGIITCILSLIPLVGIIIFFINRKDHPKKAKTAIICAVIGFVLPFVFNFIFRMISMNMQ